MLTAKVGARRRVAAAAGCLCQCDRPRLELGGFRRVARHAVADPNLRSGGAARCPCAPPTGRPAQLVRSAVQPLLLVPAARHARAQDVLRAQRVTGVSVTGVAALAESPIRQLGQRLGPRRVALHALPRLQRVRKRGAGGEVPSTAGRRPERCGARSTGLGTSRALRHTAAILIRAAEQAAREPLPAPASERVVGGLSARGGLGASALSLPFLGGDVTVLAVLMGHPCAALFGAGVSRRSERERCRAQGEGEAERHAEILPSDGSCRPPVNCRSPAGCRRSPPGGPRCWRQRSP